MQPAQVTGLVLCGGRGSRMGGVDKGLQTWHGEPLARHALERLRPQVGALAINANRHLDRYAGFGVPVWPDAMPDFPGPLAGFLAGLAHCRTDWLLTVPCDAPLFPEDLAARLAAAAEERGAELAIAAHDGPDDALQPVFCLMRRGLAPALQRYLADGGRRVGDWARQQQCAYALFEEPGAFANVNTVEELQALQAGHA